MTDLKRCGEVFTCRMQINQALSQCIHGRRTCQQYKWYSVTVTAKQVIFSHTDSTHTHTHTRLTALFPGLPRRAGTRKVKPILILLKQETVSGSGISWAVCKSAPRSRQITTPAPHHSVFLQAGCPSCRPTNSVKALLYELAIFCQPSNWV